MTRAIDLMHTRAEAWRRRSILEGVVGFALLFVTVLCAMQNETWHATLAGIAAGATISAAALTYAKARLWERVAAERSNT
jgi:hypothetical protein